MPPYSESYRSIIGGGQGRAVTWLIVELVESFRKIGELFDGHLFGPNGGRQMEAVEFRFQSFA